MKKLLPLLLFFFACQKSKTQTETPVVDPPFEQTPTAFQLKGGRITEASGITDSKSVPGHIWVQQDSGNPPMIYLVKHDGTIMDSVLLAGASNRDWEDMTAGPGPSEGKQYLYIGDIGDNNAAHPNCTIYRFEEPAAGVKSLNDYDRINYTYVDGARDAEAFVVDNNTKDIYIISKREQKSRLYRLAYPQSTTAMNQAEYIAELNYNQVVSAALGSGGTEMIVKTYTQLFHYKRKSTETITKMLESVPDTLGYQLEPQGEAITLTLNNSGFFTLSEEALGIEPKLNFYKRK